MLNVAFIQPGGALYGCKVEPSLQPARDINSSDWAVSPQ